MDPVMDIDDKEFEGTASSANPVLDEQGTEAAQADASQPVDAASSPATGEDDDGLLSVVRDVVGASRKPDDLAAPPAAGEENSEDGQQEPTAQDDEDYSDVPFHKHPRFQQLLRKAKTHEQDATRYRNVQNFMDQNGLEANEAADLLIVGGLMKTNPVEAYRLAKPMIKKLLIAAGEVLPADLQQRVRAGELNQQAALEVSRSRATQQSVETARSFEQQRNARTSQQQVLGAARGAAESWAAERHRKDPNFEAKWPSFIRELTFLQRFEGVPNTPDGVRAQLQKAYKGVVPPAASAAPQPRPVKQAITPVRGGAVAGSAAPKVENTMDVLKNVMAKRRSA